ncbi:uncharacterized protein DUF3325 [Novosphingobium sp. PhB57]|uniref:DUF3325 domain-containing protein n=1 Tax=Novosphingobium sp. PhB57 TaxID=2485107 RepID=UPI00104F6C58|nr:DUF3325 domain-containing protein [Novosphingobium sp. PhB57]TCU61902.1 uncharacterized protein DUF3325 [Novosphingobium sp. PhB57]
MIHLLAVLLSAAAFTALALSIKRHQRDFAGRALTERESRLARTGGWSLVGLVLAIDIAVFGFGYALVAWAGQLTMGAWLNVAWLCWKTGASRKN